ncbi:MAG TPA: hypothetical protein PKD92_07760 [Novosphingobium sp.]|nr:hypothetical protein [Novosphingobium sp.]HMP56451.1 hypothetical protein [Novosphingobium sp.]
MAMIVALIGVVASLFLAVRSWQSHGLSLNDGLKMGLTWAAIIAIAAFVLSRFVV